ncbi:hypothetical protein BDM02DRAFT_1912429 [Thelephora ganbajun]|uniref:Uncharacterized protein n=1 Tax=Thelephora ganbajun TaxID=370292 RepID=A0ACB6ZVI5_THEGA|nr:hypothetical protein BDM02DRAFT_1912429 [Thelephora ganbajun]
MQVPGAHNRGRQTILADVNVFRRQPSPQDVTELQALIAKNESSLTLLNEEIEACSRQLSALRTRSYAHVLTIRKCQAAMTLARLIPQELLAKIFEHASETGWTRAPVVVSHVCSAWRAAAQSHPSVWSRVTVNLDMRDPVGWTEYWLSMARQAFLHVTIVHTVPTTTLGQVMALLLEHSERWISLTLDLHLADTRQVLAMCTTRFTRLRSIYVSLFTIDENIEAAEGTTGFTNAFRDVSTLASVSIVGNILPRDLPPRLTSLRIEYSDIVGSGIETPRVIIEALRNLPELETLNLRLGVTILVSMAPLDIPNIELPNLRTLVYDDLRTGEFPILNHLTAPSLTHLHAHVQPDPEVFDAPSHLIRFLEDSPNVETLELDGVDIWPAQWLSTLPLLPKLRKLHLHDSDIDGAVIEKMFGENGLCPDLQRIDLRWCQHVRGTTLVRLVESRMKEGGCEIEEVAAIGCSLVRKQDAMQLATLTKFRVVIGERDEYCREFDFLSHFSARSSTDLVFAQARGDVAITSNIVNGSSSTC